VFFNRLGEIRDRSFEQQRYRASGLNLVTAAIVLWNTVYLERAANALRGHGQAVDDGLLQYLSPLGWEHINLTGDYLWRSSAKIGAGKFRPLRPLQPAACFIFRFLRRPRNDALGAPQPERVGAGRRARRPPPTFGLTAASGPNSRPSILQTRSRRQPLTASTNDNLNRCMVRSMAPPPCSFPRVVPLRPEVASSSTRRHQWTHSAAP
jgi:hypothetical protein